MIGCLRLSAHTLPGLHLIRGSLKMHPGGEGREGKSMLVRVPGKEVVGMKGPPDVKIEVTERQKQNQKRRDVMRPLKLSQIGEKMNS